MAVVLCYLWVQCLGLLALVALWRTCRALPDRGWCAAKTLGALLIGLITWWGWAAGVLENTSGGAAIGVLALAGAGVLASGGALGATFAEIAAWVRRHLRLVVTIELLFALAFFGWCWVRANDPAADHTEEPMDLMLLVAVSSSDSFPAIDPWLSGYPISYYYLGYWLLGALGHLVGTPPEITYNLGQAAWYALLVVGCFGLAYDLAAFGLRPRAQSTAPSRSAVGAGLVAALVVGASSNIALALDWGRRVLAGTGSVIAEAVASWQALFLGKADASSAAAALWSENWWWWRSSRVVRDIGLDGKPIEVITEFPFFSYLLGDNHPHVMAMPIVVALLTLAFAVLARAGAADAATATPGAVTLRADAPDAGGRARLANSGIGRVTRLGIVAVAGSIVAINTWDVPAAWTILALAFAGAGAFALDGAPARRRAAISAAGFAAMLAMGVVVLYLPYHLTASSQVQGILPNLFHPTAIGQVAVMFATLAPGIVVLALSAWRDGEAKPRLAALWWVGILGAAIGWLLLCGVLVRFGVWSAWIGSIAGENRGGVLGIALSRWSTGWPTLAVGAAALAVLVEALRARWTSSEARREVGVNFALLLAAVGVTLVLVPELVYLHDSFGTRMNTVFKFWYQAWLLLACAAAVGIAVAARRRGGPRLAAMVALLAIAPGLFYPVAALWSKTGGFGAQTATLDAVAWLERFRPDELQAIRWLRASTPPGAVVAQRSGASYRAEQNLPSIVTGRPTLLGWGGHEFQWRGASFGSFSAGREEALERLYHPPSAKELDQTLRTWSVQYVYLGPEERARYEVTAGDESVLAEAMDVVFENAQVRIYQRRG